MLNMWQKNSNRRCYLTMSCGFLEKLKSGERRQIQIPMDKGRNMLGVMDETGQLKYGQVYVQFTSMESQQLVVLTGEVSYHIISYHISIVDPKRQKRLKLETDKP